MPRALARIESVAPCISKTALNGATVQLAAALLKFAANSVCPGWVQTDMGGDNATRSVAKGASGIVWLAADAPQNQTSKFWRDRKNYSVVTLDSGVSRITDFDLYCRFRRGSLPCARPLLSDAPFTRSGFSLPLSRFFAFLAPLLLIQIPSEPLISKTAAETGSGNRKCSCDLNRPLARCHVPWTFV